MTVHALPNYRPDCAVCGCPMDGHYGDGGDAGCRGYVFAEVRCSCPGYYYPFEPCDKRQEQTMKDFAGNKIDEPAMLQAIASIDWSRTDECGYTGDEPTSQCIGCLVDSQPHTCGFKPIVMPERWRPTT